MSSILFYIDPEISARRQMVRMAADLVEVLTFDAKAECSHEYAIGIVAEPSICLEVGLSMLGRGEARTIEGGERRKSPVTIYPFVSKSNRSDAEFSLLGRNTSFNGEVSRESGFLDDLYALGAFEREPDFAHMDWQELNAHFILKKLLHSGNIRWNRVLIFGDSMHESDLESPWKRFDVEVEHVTSFYHDEMRVHSMLKLLEYFSQDDVVHKAQVEAVISALQFEELLSRFAVKRQTMGGSFW